MIEQGDSNYVETLQDCIRIALIFTDFHQINFIITHNDLSFKVTLGNLTNSFNYQQTP